MRTVLLGCLLAGCATTSTSSAPPLPHPLVASTSAQTVWALGTPAKKPASTTPSGRRTIWVTTTACMQPGDAGARAPSFDAKRCVGIIERVVIDADVSDADAVRVEKLSVESAALKLETLLPGGDAEGDSGD